MTCGLQLPPAIGRAKPKGLPCPPDSVPLGFPGDETRGCGTRLKVSQQEFERPASDPFSQVNLRIAATYSAIRSRQFGTKILLA
jgi:hypothetical protein